METLLFLIVILGYFIGAIAAGIVICDSYDHEIPEDEAGLIILVSAIWFVVAPAILVARLVQKMSR